MATKTPELCAWAAGFFDGEGHISIRYQDGHSWHVAIEVAQQSLPALMLLQEHWGGQVRTNPSAYRWKLNNFELMKQFIVDVAPYLVVRADEAEALINYFLLGKGTDAETFRKRTEYAANLQSIRAVRKAQFRAAQGE